MKSSFQKSNKCQFKNRACNVNAKFGEHVLKKEKALHKYVHIHKCESLFSKTQSMNLTLALQVHFLLGIMLIVFRKRAIHIHIHIFTFITYIYIYIHTNIYAHTLIYAYGILFVVLHLSNMVMSRRLYLYTYRSFQSSSYTYTYIYVYKHIYIYIYLHTYICT